jgi:hypothetical protein
VGESATTKRLPNRLAAFVVGDPGFDEDDEFDPEEEE